MGEIIYFQRCNAPNGPNISSIIVKNICKIKEELQIGCIRIYLIFPNLRGAEPGPKPRKLKFLIGFLSKSSQYNINV